MADDVESTDMWADWSDAHLLALINDPMAHSAEVALARAAYIKRGRSRV